MKLLDLPNELLLLIISSVEDNLDLFSFMQSDPQLKALILPHLYQLVSETHEGDEIHYFSKHGMLPCVEYSLNMGADIDGTDSVDDRSALSFAAGFGHPVLVEYLLDRGADINSGTGDGLTPLHYAAFEGHTNTLQLLIARGADPDLMAEDNLNECVGTPLSEAARGGHPEVVRILLDKGADISTVDDTGMTTLLWAARAGMGSPLRYSIRSCLSEEQSPSGLRHSTPGPGPGECLDWVIDRNQPRRKIDVETPFECSVPRNYLDTVKLLVEHGADCNRATISAQGFQKCVPLVAAAWGGDLEIVKFLVDKGANVKSSVSRPLATPLHAASWRGNVEIVEFLIDKGADVNSRGREPFSSPMLTAMDRSQRAVGDIIWAAGGRMHQGDLETMEDSESEESS